MSTGRPRRRALLLGCGTFADDKLAPLRSPRHDVTALGQVLRAPTVGDYVVTESIDATRHQACLAIEGFFKSARVSDALNLLYLSCHGVQDPQGRLHFAFADTDQTYLDTTGVSAEWIRDRIYASRSKATVVLIDCCYSGAFIRGMRARSTAADRAAVLVRDLPEGTGVTVMTASGETEASFEDADSAVAVPSYFTEAVITGLSTGAADLDRDGRITVDELYSYVYDRVVGGRSSQRPRKFSMGEGTLLVANAAIPASAPPPTVVAARSAPVAVHEPADQIAAKCRVLLDQYTEHVPGVTHVGLVGWDGLPIAVFGPLRREEAERSAALIWGLSYAASSATRLAGAGPADVCTVNFDRGMLMVKAVGDLAVLGVLLADRGDIDAAMHRSTQLVKELAAALERSDLTAVSDAFVTQDSTGPLSLVHCRGPVHGVPT